MPAGCTGTPNCACVNGTNNQVCGALGGSCSDVIDRQVLCVQAG
jgi:hypothetical protein